MSTGLLTKDMLLNHKTFGAKLIYAGIGATAMGNIGKTPLVSLKKDLKLTDRPRILENTNIKLMDELFSINPKVLSKGTNKPYLPLSNDNTKSLLDPIAEIDDSVQQIEAKRQKTFDLLSRSNVKTRTRR